MCGVASGLGLIMSVTGFGVRRLYRSRTDRILGGVCGGLGEYLGVDSNLIRIIWILLSFVYGVAIILYIIAWILLPEKPEIEVESQGAPPQPTNWTLIVGLILVGLGVLTLLKSFLWISIRFLEPTMLLLAGAILVLAGLRYGTRGKAQNQ